MSDQPLADLRVIEGSAFVSAPLGGMTQYLDLASWTAGLMIWALVPWVWSELRRTMFGAANPATLLVLVYLLVIAVGLAYVIAVGALHT